MSASAVARDIRKCLSVAMHPLTWCWCLYLAAFVAWCVCYRPENDRSREGVWSLVWYSYTIIAGTIPLIVG